MDRKIDRYRIRGCNAVYYIDYSSGDVRMKGLKMVVIIFGVVIAILMIMLGSLIVEAEESDKEDWRDYIEIVCYEREICPELVEAIIERESNWDPYAANGDCIGLMQISEKWHKDRMERLGVDDLKDPYDNILVGVDYLSELAAKYEVGLALMIYNGDSRAESLWNSGQMSDYAKWILERSAELERLHGK